MTIKAIIEMMDKLGFSNTAKHRVSYDLLESSMLTELTIVLKQNVWLVRISHPSN